MVSGGREDGRQGEVEREKDEGRKREREGGREGEVEREREGERERWRERVNAMQ